ncbi:MAG: carboxylating nicotinate-nucleotide diphosphorylase [Euryarchaeota archaeon]|nr:carboxylating nicotinate-nucleotide diphosphorylase [Euryarchaeota archaeon]
MFWKLYNEDMLFGDLTSELVIPEDMFSVARIIAREPCVVAGTEYVAEKLRALEIVSEFLESGARAERGAEIMTLRGSTRRILAAERTTLNILSRLCGIATETRRIVDEVRKSNPNVRIAATRKTLWGALDKQAVIAGGGDPHRWNLGDMVMIKDNHIAMVGMEEAIKRAKRASFTKKIEVEVESENAALRAAELGADIIMLDNMAPEQVCQIAGKLRKYRVLIEVSGGITPENVKDYARCDIDIISMGHLTHSSKPIDLSMELSAL